MEGIIGLSDLLQSLSAGKMKPFSNCCHQCNYGIGTKLPSEARGARSQIIQTGSRKGVLRLALPVRKETDLGQNHGKVS